MMILAAPPSPAAHAAPLEDELLRTFSELSISQGDDGRVVFANLASAASHWFDRPQILAEMANRGLVRPVAGDDFDLPPVPRQTVGVSRVRYAEGERIKPLPYPLDDE